MNRLKVFFNHVLSFMKNTTAWLKNKINGLRKKSILWQIKLIPHRKKILISAISAVLLFSMIFAVAAPLIKNAKKLETIERPTTIPNGTNTANTQKQPFASEQTNVTDILNVDDSDELDGAADSSRSSTVNLSSGGTTVQYCTVYFAANGGAAVKPVNVQKGKKIAVVPRTNKQDGLFAGWYTDEALTNKFYSDCDVISEDITLYAKYEDFQSPQTKILYETYALQDSGPDLTFTINSSNNLTTQQVLDLLDLKIEDGSALVGLNVTGSNPYQVSAEGGFTPGAAYRLTLGDGLTFNGKLDSCRSCTFTIAKSDVINLKVSENVIFIPADQVSDIVANGESVDTLSVAMIDNVTSVTGTFTYYGEESLANEMLVCVYQGTHPNSRTLGVDYQNHDVAYIKITEVSDTTVSYKNIENSDIEEVLFFPDTIPLDMRDFDDNEFEDGELQDFDFDPADYFHYQELEFDENTTLDVGDFIVLYDDEGINATKYLEIKSVTPDGELYDIQFSSVSLADMKQSMDYHVTQTRSGNDMLASVDVSELESQIESQVISSGFAQNALTYLAVVSSQTQGFQEISGVESLVLKHEDGSLLSQEEIELLWDDIIFTYTGDSGITVTASISENPHEFNEGVRVALEISGTYTVEIDEDNTIDITMTATFVQEVSIEMGVDSQIIWGEMNILGVPIPYPKDYKLTTVISVGNFSAVSFEVQVASVATSKNFDITNQLKDLLKIEDPDELDAGVEDLFEKYGEMLETKTDYVDIFSESIFSKEGWVDPFHIFVYRVEMDVKVKADINIMLGANLEYKKATAYIFWFKAKSEKTGSSTMDLVPEEFAFQFYVMGKLGLKMGIEFKFDVGLFSTSLACIGVSAEAGPYLELYGYFIYEYYKVRAMNQPDWAEEERIMGALYVEFGVYFESYFNLDALSGSYEESYELYSDKWKLLEAGVSDNVYDFAYDIESDEAFVLRNSEPRVLPDTYRNMRVLDLKTGDLKQAIYKPEKYSYELSNKYFDFDKESGVITAHPPKGVQYMECDLTLTWKIDKLAFSQTEIDSTIHLVWTNLSSSEFNEKYTVTVRVGNEANGYTTVWSKRVRQNQEFNLPKAAEIETLIGYDEDTVIVDGHTRNLKYLDYDGYESGVSNPQTVIFDKVYLFDVTDRLYKLEVENTQNASQTEFYAKYSEAFNLSPLESSGSTTDPYTKYLRTNCSDDGVKATDVIGRAFAIQLLGNKGTYEAEYVDTTCFVTYHFVTDNGTEIADYVERVNAGTMPTFDYVDYLSAVVPAVTVDHWAVPIKRVTESTTFVAYCKYNNATIYKITFEENGGEEIKDYKGVADQTIKPTEIEDPKREGYTFEGWYSDEALMEPYTITTMPGDNITLYAKWEAIEYKVTLLKGTYGEEDQEITVVFGEEYGELPDPVMIDQAHGFLGWYTSPTLAEETKVTADSLVNIASDHDLYPHYKALIKIPEDQVNDDGIQTTTYNAQAQGYTISFKDLEGVCEGYEVYYLWVKDGNDKTVDWANNEYQKSVTDAGTYNVQIRRAQDDTYQEYKKTLPNTFVINQATRSIPVNSLKVTAKSRTFSSITVNPIEVPKDASGFDSNQDGIIMYAAVTGEETPQTHSLDWTTSCTISGLASNKLHRIWSKVSGGNNYKDAYCSLAETACSTSSTMTSAFTLVTTVDYYFKTADESGAGTSANVYAKIIYRDGGESTDKLLTGNFERGSEVDGCYATYGGSPWGYKQVAIYQDGEGAGDEWLVHTWGIGAQGWNYDQYIWDTFKENDAHTYDLPSWWLRAVRGRGNFDTWGGGYTISESSSDEIKLTYDGEVVDQYEGISNDSYNSSYPPYVSVTVNGTNRESIYGCCFHYSNYEFVVDEAKMYDAMQRTGDTSVTFTAKLIFPGIATMGANVFEQKITITAQ